MSRAPLVVHVTGAAPPLGRDELTPALDVGAAVVVSSTVQEAVDLTLAARRAVEDAETPLLHVCDVRTSGPAIPLGADQVAAFLQPAPRVERPATSAVDAKRAERSFTSRVPFALASAMRQLGDATGRALGPIDRADAADAEEIVVAYGCAVPAARDACAALRAEGRKVGLVAVRALRPFSSSDCVKALLRARAIVVLEPLDVALAPGGPAAMAIKCAFTDAITWTPGYPGVGRIPPIVAASFATLDHGVRVDDVRAALDELAAGDRARRTLVFGA
jgi:pyruvate-ferredoxin/flavodoxin oxidoreductase